MAGYKKTIIHTSKQIFKPGMDLDEELESFLALSVGFHLDESGVSSKRYVKVTVEVFEYSDQDEQQESGD